MHAHPWRDLSSRATLTITQISATEAVDLSNVKKKKMWFFPFLYFSRVEDLKSLLLVFYSSASTWVYRNCWHFMNLLRFNPFSKFFFLSFVGGGGGGGDCHSYFWLRWPSMIRLPELLASYLTQWLVIPVLKIGLIPYRASTNGILSASPITILQPKWHCITVHCSFVVLIVAFSSKISRRTNSFRKRFASCKASAKDLQRLWEIYPTQQSLARRLQRKERKPHKSLE